MKTLILSAIMTLCAFAQDTRLDQVYSSNELERMGGTYMAELYLFLDGVYCDEEEVRFTIVKEFCMRSYLKELLLIKKHEWSKHFYKESEGVFSKPNIMEEDSPLACDVTLEVVSSKEHYFNIYCDY